MIVPMARRDDNGHDEVLGQRIAQNIQALLRANHLTQGQLAYKAGLPQSGISALVIGRRNPSLNSIYKISQAFGVSIEELAGFKPLQIPEYVESDTPSDSQSEARISKIESGLNDTRREMAATNDRLAQMSDLLAELLESRSQAKSRRGGTQKKAS